MGNSPNCYSPRKGVKVVDYVKVGKPSFADFVASLNPDGKGIDVNIASVVLLGSRALIANGALIKVYDLITNKSYDLSGHSAPLAYIDIAGASDGEIRVWGNNLKECLLIVSVSEAPRGPVHCIACVDETCIVGRGRASIATFPLDRVFGDLQSSGAVLRVVSLPDELRADVVALDVWHTDSSALPFVAVACEDGAVRVYQMPAAADAPWVCVLSLSADTGGGGGSGAALRAGTVPGVKLVSDGASRAPLLVTWRQQTVSVYLVCSAEGDAAPLPTDVTPTALWTWSCGFVVQCVDVEAPLVVVGGEHVLVCPMSSRVPPPAAPPVKRPAGAGPASPAVAVRGAKGQQAVPAGTVQLARTPQPVARLRINRAAAELFLCCTDGSTFIYDLAKVSALTRYLPPPPAPAAVPAAAAAKDGAVGAVAASPAVVKGTPAAAAAAAPPPPGKQMPGPQRPPGPAPAPGKRS